jgi:hypothetical protein
VGDRQIRESIIKVMEGDDHAVEMDFRPTRLFGAER